jgi:hypothetical protein
VLYVTAFQSSCGKQTLRVNWKCVAVAISTFYFLLHGTHEKQDGVLY